MTALGHMAAQLSVAQRGLSEVAKSVAAAQQHVKAGIAGEELVEGLLADLGLWHLAGRHRAGGRSGDIDFIVATRSGVFVIDVKHWAEVQIDRGRLYQGQDERTETFDKVMRLAQDAEEALSSTGLSPLEVHPLLVFSRDGAALSPQQLGRLVVVGADHLRRIVVPSADRLPAVLLAAVRERLEAAFPVRSPQGQSAEVLAPSGRRRSSDASGQLQAFDLEAVDLAQLRFADTLPLERWMVWLDPVQQQHVRRTWSGPARVRGPAGTGKTVLALHRAAYLAESSPGRILVTSYVRTLPAVLAALYRRISPRTVERVDFVNLHALAHRVLKRRMIGHRLDSAQVESAFSLAWVQVGRASLESLGLGVTYWREEIDAVIKGRDLRRRELYLDAERVGRRTPLGAAQREAVWQMYEVYEAELRRRRVCDWNDILRMARDSLWALPMEPPYRHVLADEVQDFPTVGLQLLRRLVAEQPDDLFLVGDGQQAIYPGGGTLKEAGIAVTGRGVNLSVNYRNPKEILDAAFDVVADQRYDDLEGADEPGVRQVATLRVGGHCRMATFHSAAEQDAGLVAQIRADAANGCQLSGMAVLVTSRAESRHMCGVLRAAGLPVQALEEWDGAVGAESISVGTIKRSKGLEFDAVYLANFDPRPPAITEEERERRRREVFVAITRARSHLWTGCVV